MHQCDIGVKPLVKGSGGEAPKAGSNFTIK